MISTARGCAAGGVGPDTPATCVRIAVTWSGRIRPWFAHCSTSTHKKRGSGGVSVIAFLPIPMNLALIVVPNP